MIDVKGQKVCKDNQVRSGFWVTPELYSIRHRVTAYLFTKI